MEVFSVFVENICVDHMTKKEAVSLLCAAFYQGVNSKQAIRDLFLSGEIPRAWALWKSGLPLVNTDERWRPTDGPEEG